MPFKIENTIYEDNPYDNEKFVKDEVSSSLQEFCYQEKFGCGRRTLQFFTAFFFTVLSGFIGLFSESLRDTWSEFGTGLSTKRFKVILVVPSNPGPGPDVDVTIVAKSADSVAKSSLIPPPSLSQSSFDNLPAKDPKSSIKPCQTILEIPNQNEKDPDLNVLKRRAGHILGDLFIGSSGLEGYDSRHMLNHVCQFLTYKIHALQKLPKTQQVVDTITKYIEIQSEIDRGLNSFVDLSSASGAPTEAQLEKAVEKTQEAITKLKPGESLLLIGGYAGIPSGHAMYYRIKKEKNDTYSMQLFNTGDGVTNHVGIRIEQPNAPAGKPKYIKKYSPYLEVVDIAPEKMLNPSFWRAIHEIRSCTIVPKHSKKEEKEEKASKAASAKEESNIPTKYESGDIYDNLLPLLHGRIKDQNDPKRLNYMIPQHSGICAWASLRAFLCSQLVPEEFDRLDYEIQSACLKGLYAAYSNHFDKLLVDENARSLLSKGLQHLAVKLMNYRDSKIISKEEMDLSSKFMKEVETTLKTIEETRKQRLEKNRNRHLDLERSFVQDFYGTISDLNVHDFSQEAAPLIPKDPGVVWGLNMQNWKPDPATIAKELSALYKEYQEAANEEPHSVAFCLQELFAALPLPKKENDEFWGEKGVSQNDLIHCMESIAKLSGLLTTLCQENNVDFESRALNSGKRISYIIGLYKGLAIQHKLAMRSEALQRMEIEKWSLGTEFSTFFENPSTGDSNIYDHGMNMQREAITRYLPSKGQPDFFKVSKYQDGYSPQNLDTDSIEEGPIVYKYFLLNKEKFDKTLKEEWYKWKSIFDIVDSDKGSASYALSDAEGIFLPVEFCLLRKQAMLAFYYLKYASIFDLEDNLNRLHVGCDLDPNSFIYRVSLRVLYKSRDIYPFPIFHNRPVFDCDLIGHIRHILSDFWKEQISCDEFREKIKIKDLPEGISAEEVANLTGLKLAPLVEMGAKSQELQIIKAIDYFNIHINKLNDHDMQCFLRMIIFGRSRTNPQLDRDYLTALLENNPEYSNRIVAFLQKGYYHFLGRKDTNSMTYMLYLAQMLEERLTTVAKTNGASAIKRALDLLVNEGDKNLHQMQRLNDLLKQDFKDPTEKSFVVRQLLYGYAQLLDKGYVPKELGNIVACLTWLQVHPIPDKYRFCHLNDVIERLEKKLLPYLIQNSKDQKSITQMIKSTLDFFGPIQKNSQPFNWEEIKWDCSKFPFWIGTIKNFEKFRFDVQNFQLSEEGHSFTSLPSSILKNIGFERVFPNFKQPSIVFSENGTYKFKDSNGCPVLTYKNPQKFDDEIIIWKQFSANEHTSWYEYRKAASTILKSLGKAKFLKKKSCWKACLDNKFVLCSPGTTEITHEIVPGKNHTEFNITNVATKYRNCNLLNSHDKNGLVHPYNLLSNLENYAYIHVWVDKNSGLCQLIEMPRLSLYFFRNAEGKMQSAQVTGYYLAENQHLTGLRDFKNYLVLENGKGKIKALIIREEISSYQDTGGLISGITLKELDDDLIDEVDGKSKFPLYFEYAVEKNREELKALHVGGSLFLAYLFQGQRRYKDAQMCLREHAVKFGTYTPREREIFTWIWRFHDDSKDNDPKSLALYLTAVALYWYNRQIHGNSKKTPLLIDHRNVQNIYIDYLSSLPYVGDLHLLAHEELVIAKEVLPDEADSRDDEDSFIEARLLFLTNNSESDISSIHEFTPYRGGSLLDLKYGISNFLRYCLNREVNDAYKNVADRSCLVTRPNALNQQYKPQFRYKLPFKVAYEQALKVKTYSEGLKLAQAFELESRFMRDCYGINIFDNNIANYYLLMAVALNPKEFPPYNELEFNIDSIGDTVDTIYTSFIRLPKQVEEKEKYEKNVKENVNELEEKYKNENRNLELENKNIQGIPSVQEVPKFKIDNDKKIEIEIKEKESEQQKKVDEDQIELFKLPEAEAKDQINPSSRGTDWYETWLHDAKPQTKKESEEKSYHAHISQLKKELTKEHPNCTNLEKNALKELSDDIYTDKPQKFILRDSHNRNELVKNVALRRVQLEKKRLDAHQKSVIQLNQLLADVNQQFPEEPVSQEQLERSAYYQAELLSSQKRAITLDDLMVFILGKNTEEALMKQNPNLTKLQTQKISEQLTQYLVTATEKQSYQRQIKSLEAILAYENTLAKDRVDLSKDLTLQELGYKAHQEHVAKRAYIPEGNSAFLIFEYVTEFALRPDQVDSINKLIKADHMIIQRIMGSGKSKILLPILALLLADGDNLPTIILPESLYETVIHDLKNSMGEVFKRAINTLSFGRNTEFTESKLQNILDYLNKIRKSRQCVLMTSKSAHCLALKYKETLLEFMANPKNKVALGCLELLQSILKLFKVNGKAIIDEADTVLNAKVTTNFTTGKGVNLDLSRCQLIASIYEELTNEKLCKDFGGDPLKKYSLSIEEYQKSLKPLLQKKILVSAALNSDHPLASVMKGISQQDLAIINEYLSGIKNENNEKFISNMKDHQARELLSLLKEELNELLPLSLSKRYCVDYGPSEKLGKKGQNTRMLAVPYNGNNMPVKGSEFRSPDMLMNYTLQTWWEKGIPASDILERVQEFRADVARQMKLGGIPLNKTAGFMAFQNLCGKELYEDLDLEKCGISECEKIAKSLNDSRKTHPRRFFKYITEHILSKIKVHDEQLSDSAIDLVGMFKSTIGFTGTPWNSDSYAEKLRVNTEKTAGVNGQTAVLLYEKVTQEGIRILKNEGFASLTRELVRKEDDALIDVGALFNGHGNEKVAREILSTLIERGSNKRGVIFFRKNLAVMLEAIKKEGGEGYNTRIVTLDESTLKPEERFTYYDDAHTVGTDILQHGLAKATLTVNEDETVFKWDQGAWRLRALDKQQSISLAITTGAYTRARHRFGIKAGQPLAFSDLLRFVTGNQAELQMAHLIMSTSQKINHVIKQAIIDRLLRVNLSRNNDKEAVELIKDVKHILVTKQSHSAFDNYGIQDTLEESSDVIKAIVDSAKKQIQDIRKDSPLFDLKPQDKFLDDIMEKIKIELGNTIQLLPKKLSTKVASGRNHENLVEKQAVQEKQSDKELEMLSQSYTMREDQFELDPPEWSTYSGKGIVVPNIFKDLFHGTFDEVGLQYKRQVYNLGGIYKCQNFCNSSLAKFSSIVDQVQVSAARLHTSKMDMDFHNRQQLPMQYVLFKRCAASKNGLQLELIDTIGDLPFLWQALSHDRQGKFPKEKGDEMDFCLCSLDGKIVQSSSGIDTQKNDDPFMAEMAKRGPELRLRAKVALGELYYSREELDLMAMIWRNDRKLLGEYFMHIMNQNPNKLMLFKESQLYHWLGKASNQSSHSELKEEKSKK